jgi:hypothetical protein
MVDVATFGISRGTWELWTCQFRDITSFVNLFSTSNYYIDTIKQGQIVLCRNSRSGNLQDTPQSPQSGHDQYRGINLYT